MSGAVFMRGSTGAILSLYREVVLWKLEVY